MREIKQDRIGFLDVASYLFQGIKIALNPECRMFLVIPVLINLILLSFCGYALYANIKPLIISLFESFPDFLIFIAYIITGLLAITIFVMSCYIFSTVATIIASPFYGLLADRVENILNGTKGDDLGLIGIIKDIPRIIRRECRKQLFFLPLALLCLVITFIPFINIIAPLCWFLLTSWMGCIQYTDYAYDNHRISFKSMHSDLKRNLIPSFTLGAMIAFLMAVPVVNLIIPPAAVCAGTKYYLQMQKYYSLQR